MKMMLLAAAAMMTLGTATAAFADGGDAPVTSLFTQYQAGPQQPSQQQQPVAATPSQGRTAVYSMQAHDQGTWLFQPDTLGGGSR